MHHALNFFFISGVSFAQLIMSEELGKYCICYNNLKYISIINILFNNHIDKVYKYIYYLFIKYFSVSKITETANVQRLVE